MFYRSVYKAHFRLRSRATVLFNKEFICFVLKGNEAEFEARSLVLDKKDCLVFCDPDGEESIRSELETARFMSAIL